MKSEHFVFPVADVTVKISGGDRRLRTSTLILDRPERGEEREVFRGESDGLSSPTPLQGDSTLDDEEAKKWFLVYYRRFHLSPSCGTPSQNVRAERRIIPYSTEVHRRYQNNTYVTGCVDGDNIDDFWNVGGEEELSDAWTGFTRFILLNERAPDGNMMNFVLHLNSLERDGTVPNTIPEALLKWCRRVEPLWSLQGIGSTCRGAGCVEPWTCHWNHFDDGFQSSCVRQIEWRNTRERWRSSVWENQFVWK